MELRRLTAVIPTVIDSPVLKARIGTIFSVAIGPNGKRITAAPLTCRLFSRDALTWRTLVSGGIEPSDRICHLFPSGNGDDTGVLGCRVP
jgi:hypothetical protein